MENMMIMFLLLAVCSHGDSWSPSVEVSMWVGTEVISFAYVFLK